MLLHITREQASADDLARIVDAIGEADGPPSDPSAVRPLACEKSAALLVLVMRPATCPDVFTPRKFCWNVLGAWWTVTPLCPQVCAASGDVVVNRMNRAQRAARVGQEKPSRRM